MQLSLHHVNYLGNILYPLPFTCITQSCMDKLTGHIPRLRREQHLLNQDRLGNFRFVDSQNCDEQKCYSEGTGNGKGGLTHENSSLDHSVCSK